MYWWDGHAESLKGHLFRFLFRYPKRISNFGDQISPFLVSSVAGRPVVHSTNEGKLLAVGSVLHGARSNDVIWGSGMMTRKVTEHLKTLEGLRLPLSEGR